MKTAAKKSAKEGQSTTVTVSSQHLEPQKKRSHARKPKTAREVLDLIDEFLADKKHGMAAQGEAIKLWAVLSALRGPDEALGDDLSSYYIKKETTANIRTLAFPKASERLDVYMTIADVESAEKFLEDTERGVFPLKMSKASPHFQNHIRNAARALNDE